MVGLTITGVAWFLTGSLVTNMAFVVSASSIALKALMMPPDLLNVLNGIASSLEPGLILGVLAAGFKTDSSIIFLT